MSDPDDAPFRVLAVCTANICRSPAAELLLRRAFAVAGVAADVTSAGGAGFNAAPIDAQTAQALAEMGVEAGDFRSRALDTREVDAADLVLTATVEHRRVVLTRAPRALRKTFTLKEFAALAGEGSGARSSVEVVAAALAARGSRELDVLDIEDPYRRGLAQQRRAVAEIERCAHEIASALGSARGGLLT